MRSSKGRTYAPCVYSSCTLASSSSSSDGLYPSRNQILLTFCYNWISLFTAVTLVNICMRMRIALSSVGVLEPAKRAKPRYIMPHPLLLQRESLRCVWYTKMPYSGWAAHFEAAELGSRSASMVRVRLGLLNSEEIPLATKKNFKNKNHNTEKNYPHSFSPLCKTSRFLPLQQSFLQKR